jgi:hypothetical protein
MKQPRAASGPPEDTRPSRQETLRTILQATQTIVLLLRFMGGC